MTTGPDDLTPTGKHHHHRKHHFPIFDTPPAATEPTGEAYRIAGYADGMVGASKPECDMLRPKFDSGLKWPDKNNPKPDDFCWDRGVSGGIRWDGTFYRDLARYSGSGALFWSSYFKPGTSAGMKNGFWINFGSGWSHLFNDDPAQILTGASQKIFWEAGHWKVVIEATKFVTLEVINVWTGIKAGGNDPAGTYTRVSGLDPVATLTIEVA